MPEQPKSVAEETPYLDVLWRMLSKNRWLISAVAVSVLVGVTFFTLGQVKVYQASATLQIDPSPASPLGRDVPAIVTMGDAFWNNQEYYATQYKIIASRKVASDAVRALGLTRDGAYLSNRPASQRSEANVSVDAAAAVLISRLRVEPIKDSRLVTLTMEDCDPVRARKVLAALVDAYLQRNVDDAVSSNSSAGDWLRSQLVKLKSDLEGSEIALHTYKADKQILSVSLDEQSNMLREEMTRLNQALTDVRTQREHVLSRSRELQKVDPNDPNDLPATELLSNVLLNQFRTNYQEAKMQLGTLQQQGKGENYPETKAAQVRVEEARAVLVGEIRNVQGALLNDLQAVTREGDGLSGLFEAAKHRAMDLNLLEIEYGRLERTKANNEKLYGVVLERSKESDLASMMRFNNVHVVDEPLENRSPIKPRVPLNIALGAVAGVFLGLMVAIGKEQLDRSIKSVEEVEREFGLPFLGTLPFASRSEAAAGAPKPGPGEALPCPELLVHDHPNSPLAEAARGIRTNLIFMSPDHPYRCLLVTSAGPGDGKTTVASSIAVAMAQASQRVLLMDCDLRRPRLHRVYERLNDVGVTSITMDLASLDKTSLATKVPNLDLLPAGPMVPNPAEFFHSAAFAALLTELKTRYDRIVIDSPPASIVSDGPILSTQVDGTVFVVRASKTLRETARKAMRSLRDVSGQVVGVVLNAFDYKRSGYGGYYYYRYASYRPEADRDETKAKNSRAN